MSDDPRVALLADELGLQVDDVAAALAAVRLGLRRVPQNPKRPTRLPRPPSGAPTEWFLLGYERADLVGQLRTHAVRSYDPCYEMNVEPDSYCVRWAARLGKPAPRIGRFSVVKVDAVCSLRSLEEEPPVFVDGPTPEAPLCNTCARTGWVRARLPEAKAS